MNGRTRRTSGGVVADDERRADKATRMIMDVLPVPGGAARPSTIPGRTPPPPLPPPFLGFVVVEVLFGAGRGANGGGERR